MSTQRISNLAGIATKLVQGRVSSEAHAAAKSASKELGISMSAYLDTLILADEREHVIERPVHLYEQQRAV